MGSGCEKKPTFKIYENRVIECCGISSPAENLVWLRKTIDEVPPYSSFFVKLYVNDENDAQFIVTKRVLYLPMFMIVREIYCLENIIRE